MQPILSSLLLSSIREDDGETDNHSSITTNNNTIKQVVVVDPNDPNESHHRVMHAVVDTTLQVMDYLEDEIDTNTYNNDEIVPLQLRLAIEDQIFGWDHFLSSLLGHVGYTVGSYLAMYWFVTFIVLHQLPWTKSSSSSSLSDHNADGQSNNHNLHPWGMPYDIFVFVRTLLSIGSAISTFRTVRRRRRVWLPRASSSAAVRKEADKSARRFVLGTELWNKMRRSYKKRRDRVRARNVRNSLEKAERLFEHRRRRLRSLDDGEILASTSVGLTRSISALSLMTLSVDDEDTDNVANDNDGRNNGGGTMTRRRSKQRRRRLPVLVTSLVSDSSCSSSVENHDDDGDDDKALDETDESTGGGSSIGFEDDAASSSGRKRADRFRRMDSHTLPNFAIESVSHDQMPFAHGEITQIPYVHGVSVLFFCSLSHGSNSESCHIL
jgi:hypothetical protein